MELTINIKEEDKVAAFINLLKEFNYIEIVDIKEDETPFLTEHKQLLKQRLDKIERGEVSFNSWDTIKKKYEK